MHNCFPARADIESVKLFESEFQVKLPPEYVEFLLNPPNSRGEKCFVIPPDGSSTLRMLFSIQGTPSLSEALTRSRNELPENMMYLGTDTGDNWLCMHLNEHGIFWVDHETLELRCLANSFSEFINHLGDPLKEADDPIEIICRDGNQSDLLKLISDRGGQVRTRYGRSIAQEAARQGNLEALDLCREMGHDLRGCIHLAAMNDHANLVKHLVLRAGVSVNETNEKGWKPLPCAMFDNELRQWLIQQGATS